MQDTDYTNDEFAYELRLAEISRLKALAAAKFQPYDVLQRWTLDSFTGKTGWLDFSTLRSVDEFYYAVDVVEGRTNWEGEYRIARRDEVIYAKGGR